MRYAKLIATGAYLPERILRNQDLPAELGTSDEWITQRTGIKQRHLAAADETTLSMAVAAAKSALANASLKPEQIDLIIATSLTAEQTFPALACKIGWQLGVKSGPQFDLQAACSGFIYALQTAQQYILSGQAQHVLLVCSELMSRVLNWQDRRTCVLFGDAAAAVVLSADTRPGILGINLYADGQYQDLLYLNKLRPEEYLYMDGNAVFKHAVKALAQAASQILQDHQLSIEQLDWLIPHQANARIIQATANHLKLPMNKVVLTVAEHANTSSASIPLALHTALTSGQIKPDTTVLFEAFGGGFTWGAGLLKL